MWILSWITDVVTIQIGDFVVGYDHPEDDEVPVLYIQKTYPNAGAPSILEVSDAWEAKRSRIENCWYSDGLSAKTLPDLLEKFVERDNSV